ncbi:hypothetical protein KC323_g290 [Hortaea werneckii]|nr:hypothetical protein KC323_g290 [Hortaea werneckii]
MKPTTAILLTSSTLLTTLSAQQTYAINPDSVDDSTKQTWCTNQQTQCPLICTQTTPSHSADTQTNTCDPTTLTYACICANGLSPNISEYSQTLPYYICQEWTNQCVANCAAADNACASSCRDDHPCGALNPTRVNTSTVSSTMSKTSGASGGAGATTTGGDTVYTGFGGDSAAAASSTGGSGDDGDGAEASGNAAAGRSREMPAVFRTAALGVGQTFGALGVVGMLVGGVAARPSLFTANFVRAMIITASDLSSTQGTPSSRSLSRQAFSSSPSGRFQDYPTNAHWLSHRARLGDRSPLERNQRLSSLQTLTTGDLEGEHQETKRKRGGKKAHDARREKGKWPQPNLPFRTAEKEIASDAGAASTDKVKSSPLLRSSTPRRSHVKRAKEREARVKSLSLVGSDAFCPCRADFDAIVMIRVIANSSLRMVDHLLIKILGNLTGKVDSVIDDFPHHLFLTFKCGPYANRKSHSVKTSGSGDFGFHALAQKTFVHAVHATANPTEPDPSAPASDPSVPVTDPRGPRVLTEAGDGNMASVPSRLLGTSSVGGDIQPLTRASLASWSFHAIAFNTRVRLFSVTRLRKRGSVVSVRKVSLRILAYAGEAPWRTRSRFATRTATDQHLASVCRWTRRLNVPCHRYWKGCRRATRRVAILLDPLLGRHLAGPSVGRDRARYRATGRLSPIIVFECIICGVASACRPKHARGHLNPLVGVERPKSVAIHDIRPNCATVAPLPFERVRSCPTDPRSSPVPSDDSPSCTSEIHVTVIERIHAELVSVSLASVSAPSSLTRGFETQAKVHLGAHSIVREALSRWRGLMPPCDSQDGLREIGQATRWIRDAVDLESDKHAFRPLGDWRSDRGMRPGSRYHTSFGFRPLSPHSGIHSRCDSKTQFAFPVYERFIPHPTWQTSVSVVISASRQLLLACSRKRLLFRIVIR